MIKGHWSEPVQIGSGIIGTRTVCSPFEALIYLEDLWPNRTGARFVHAKIACRAALEGRGEVEDARTEFLAAAKEARLALC